MVNRNESRDCTAQVSEKRGYEFFSGSISSSFKKHLESSREKRLDA